MKLESERRFRIKKGVEEGKSNGGGMGGPMGATNPGQAVHQAENEGHPADPY